MLMRDSLEGSRWFNGYGTRPQFAGLPLIFALSFLIQPLCSVEHAKFSGRCPRCAKKQHNFQFISSQNISDFQRCQSKAFVFPLSKLHHFTVQMLVARAKHAASFAEHKNNFKTSLSMFLNVQKDFIMQPVIWIQEHLTVKAVRQNHHQWNPQKSGGLRAGECKLVKMLLLLTTR